MADKEKLEAIRAEIERLKKENETYVDKDYAESQKWHMHGGYHVLFELSNFIDSLPEEPVSEPQVKELIKTQHIKETCKENGNSLTQEPVSEDLKEAAMSYRRMAENNERACTLFADIDFEAGAQWKEQQLMAKAIDGKVIANGMGNPILHLWDKGRHLIDKKVKVIVIKED